jgi:hypothetical protein
MLQKKVNQFDLQLPLIVDKFFQLIEEFPIHDHQLIFLHPDVMPRYNSCNFKKKLK